MIKALVLVPVRDNDGEPFPRRTWLELEQRLTAFGGFSRRNGVVGVWESEERLYNDISREYSTALAFWTQFPEWLSIVRWACEAFRQEAMYIEVAGLPEIIARDG